MPYTPVLNEPKYNGVYLGQLIDKPVYAQQTTQAFTGTNQPYKTFKKGEFIGTLWSWSTVGSKAVMMFYEDAYFTKPFYIPLTMPTSTPAAADIIKAEKEAGKTTLEKYIDKYAPWVVGGIVVAIALPTVVNIVTGSKKMGAMSKGSKVATLAGVALLLLAFRKKQSKNKVFVSTVQDITDWSNTENMTVYQQPRNQTTILPVKQAYLIAETASVINGSNTYKKPPTLC